MSNPMPLPESVMTLRASRCLSNRGVRSMVDVGHMLHSAEYNRLRQSLHAEACRPSDYNTLLVSINNIILHFVWYVVHVVIVLLSLWLARKYLSSIFELLSY